MKTKMLAALIISLLAVSVGAEAKSIGLTLAQIEADRKAIIVAAVAPTEQQAEQFWETYWHYRGGVSVLTDRTVEVLKEFAEAEGSLSGSRSAALVLEVMDIEKRRAKLKETYLRRFKDILEPAQVVRWYQTERKMDSVIRAEMALAVPFNDFASRTGGEPTPVEIHSTREALVMGVVQPLEDQEKPFRYVYRGYTKKANKLDDRISTLIDEYAKSYASLSDEQADRMTKEAAEIDADRAKTLSTMIYSLRADLTGKQMARLMQCELKLNAIVDFALAANIPLFE